MAGLLFHSPADIVRWLIVAVGAGTDPTLLPLQPWPVYDSVEPGAPDDVITVYNTSDQDDGRIMVDGERQQHYGIQIRVRGQTEKAGYQKAIAVAIALDGVVPGRVVSGGTLDANTYIVYVVCIRGGVLYIGMDNPTTKRPIYTINAIVPLRKLS